MDKFIFKNKNVNTQLLALLFITLGVFTRIIPHADNFTAVYAIALFAGVFLNNKKIALLVPILIMFISDLILGLGMDIVVYISFLCIVVLGTLLQQNKISLTSILTFSIASSLIFFTLTNLSVWWTSTPANGIYFYPKTISGLIKCYYLAIPFFWNTLFSTITYSIIMFYSFSIIKNRFLIKLK